MKKSNLKTIFCATLTAILLTAGPVCFAHEAEVNKATLVLREGNHLSLSLFMRLDDSMYRMSLKKTTYQEFLLAHASMPAQEFARRWLQVQEQLQNAVVIRDKQNQILKLRNWVWPTPDKVQVVIQENLMQATVASGSHQHTPLLEIRAEASAVAAAAVSSVTLQVHPVWQPLLVVSYRPVQTVLDTGEPPVSIRF